MTRAQRAFAYLQSHGPATTREIGDAIGISQNHVLSVLQPYVSARIVLRDTVPHPERRSRPSVRFWLAGTLPTEPIAKPQKYHRAGSGVITPPAYRQQLAREMLRVKVVDRLSQKALG